MAILANGMEKYFVNIYECVVAYLEAIKSSKHTKFRVQCIEIAGKNNGFAYLLEKRLYV
jgi:hypothetical protein